MLTTRCPNATGTTTFRSFATRFPIRRRATRPITACRCGAPTSCIAGSAEERPDVLHVHSITTGVGLPEIREAHRLGIRVILTCHLPGFGYMCRTGELMQWGRVPCDGIVIPSKCASCSLTRLGHGATGGPLSRRGSGAAESGPASSSGTNRHHARHERVDPRVRGRWSASCSTWSIGSSS